MRVTSISLNLRLSKELDTGGWKTLEFGAEASLAPGEVMETAAPTLYGFIKGELGKMWANGKANAYPQEPVLESVVVLPTGGTRPELPKETLKPEHVINSATDAQIRAIFGKAKALGYDNKGTRELAQSRFGKTIDDLCKKEAGNLINYLAGKGKGDK